MFLEQDTNIVKNIRNVINIEPQQLNKESINKIDEWIKKHESDIQDMLPLKKAIRELAESQEYDWEQLLEMKDEVEWVKEDLKSLRINIALLYDVVTQMRKELNIINKSLQ